MSSSPTNGVLDLLKTHLTSVTEMGTNQCCQVGFPVNSRVKGRIHDIDSESDVDFTDCTCEPYHYSEVPPGQSHEGFTNSRFQCSTCCVSAEALPVSVEPLSFFASTESQVTLEWSLMRYRGNSHGTGDDWLRAASIGRQVTLIKENPEMMTAPVYSCRRIPATLQINSALTKILITPDETNDDPACTELPVAILVDKMQLVCAGKSPMPFFRHIQQTLSEAEKGRAVLLKFENHLTDERNQVCFLDDSGGTNHDALQALTMLWLDMQDPDEPTIASPDDWTL